MVALKNNDNTLKFQTVCGEAIEGFLKEKYIQSPNTATAYRGDIVSFLDAVYEKTIDTITKEELESLDYKKLADYRNGMFGTLSNASVNRNLSTIKSMIKHLAAIEAIQSNIGFLDLVKSVRITDEESYPHATQDVVEQYMSATRFELHKKEEKRVLIMVAADTGLRLQELLDLRLSQITPADEGWYHIRGKGKGGAEFIDKISESIYNELDKVAGGNDKIFSLSRKNVWQMMTRLSKQLGYEDKGYVFHSFKKSAVSFTYKKTGSITHAMKKGRHKRPETVMRYLEDVDEGLTGMFSSQSEVDEKMFEKVSHEELLKGIKKLDKTSVLLLNIILDKTNSG